MGKFLNKLWHRIKTRGLTIVRSFFETCRSVMVLWGESLDKLWYQMKAAGENAGLVFLIPGFLLLFTLLGLSLADVQIEFTVFAILLSLALGLTSVGLGFISVGMSAKSDRRQSDLLKALDKKVSALPLIFKGDILTPPGQAAVKALVEEQSKEAAQKRLDEDTKRVGYVRGELFQNEDGTWSIHWGGKHPL